MADLDTQFDTLQRGVRSLAPTPAQGVADTLGLNQFQGLLGAVQKAYQGKEAAEAPVYEEEAKAIRQGRDEEQRLFSQIPAYNPPPPPDQRQYQTDPIRSFGSAASVFGILASGLTHQPLVNSLNAAAAAINARRANDDDAYKTAYQAWRDNVSILRDRHNTAMEEWRAIQDRNKNDIASFEAEARVHAAKWQDQIGLAQIESGLIGDYAKI